MKKTKYVLLFLIVVFLLVFIIDYKCPFKFFFHIACPGCGLSRAFIAIFQFNFNKALNYNLLSIPIFIIATFSFGMLIKDIIKKEDKYIYYFINFLKKHYLIILLILFINMIINNLRNI
ncbi:MAG: DUF2752 domain-containing protein [Bacilli bacterium]